MFEIKSSNRFSKTLKKAKEGLNEKGKKYIDDRLKIAAEALSRDAGYSLDPSFAFHYLKGHNDRGDIHLKPDVVLIFQYDRSKKVVTLDYITSHSNMKEAEKRLFSSIFRGI